MLPKYYEFQNKVKICSGINALDNLSYELKLSGASSPLVISDTMLEKLGLLKSVTQKLPPDSFTVFTNVPPDPGADVVNKAAGIFLSGKCDSIIAVGGGSVIDTAKGVRLLIASSVSDIRDLMGLECVFNASPVPFIAIPTTSGNGSEATAVAVISDTEKNIKMEYITPYLVPDTAFLDPVMTLTLPPRVTASTGVDALCHAIEAYSCLQKNPVSDSFALTAIKLISENIKTAVKKPSDKNARLSMANAAALSGAAFGNSMVGLVHAIGHSLGALCHVAHGDAMAILLPHVMEHNLKKCGNDYGELLMVLSSPDYYVKTPPENRAAETIKKVKELLSFLNKEASLPLTLSETGKVEEDDLFAVAKGAINDGASIVNPAFASEADVLSILKKAYRGGI